MNRLLLTIFAWLLLALPLQAAEEGGENDEPAPAAGTAAIEEPDEEAADQAGEQATDDNVLTEPSDENFVPTVQVSEDLPVAFPVDI